MSAAEHFPALDTTDQTSMELFLAPPEKGGERTLAEQFIVPPFTTLDTRQGYWQDRKRAWMSLGLQSELGRDVRTYGSDAAGEVNGRMLAIANGQSVFDPVLTELLYRWFCPPGGSVLDPFAGGSVRGIVASRLGLDYTGIDLSERQVVENYRQAAGMRAAGHLTGPEPRWIVGDARGLLRLLEGETKFDMVMTCPPYFDLEVYSDDPKDLSRASNYEQFDIAHRQIIKDAVATLKDNRFCAYVVGNIRDKEGYYRTLVADTAAGMEAAGARYYNEAIIIHPIGTAMLRVKRYFAPNRKLATLHQHVVIGYKGQVNAIRHDFPEET